MRISHYLPDLNISESLLPLNNMANSEPFSTSECDNGFRKMNLTVNTDKRSMTHENCICPDVHQTG
jgi:hypothetical protein